MKELHIEKFDALLSLAAAECVKDEATAFVSADLSGVEDSGLAFEYLSDILKICS